MSNSALEILSYEDIRKRADDFLISYHPERSIPIPIEEIIEFQLDIHISPLPGLKRLLGEAEIEGFLASDFSEIVVDQDVYEDIDTRYRFTLAHEIGHLMLHQEMYSRYKINNFEGRLNFVRNIPDESYFWFEWQAKAFAGLVLVPGDQLEEVVAENIDLVRKSGVRLEGPNDPKWDYVCEGVKKPFQVSSQVVDIRMNKDGLKHKYSD